MIGGWIPFWGILARGLRYDQLMKLGWRGLFPSSVVNVVVTAVVLIFLRETL